jgi:hypothetical protein
MGYKTLPTQTELLHKAQLTAKACQFCAYCNTLILVFAYSVYPLSPCFDSMVDSAERSRFFYFSASLASVLGKEG